MKKKIKEHNAKARKLLEAFSLRGVRPFELQPVDDPNQDDSNNNNLSD